MEPKSTLWLMGLFAAAFSALAGVIAGGDAALRQCLEGALLTGGLTLLILALMAIIATMRVWLPLLWSAFMIWLPLHFMCGVG